MAYDDGRNFESRLSSDYKLFLKGAKYSDDGCLVPTEKQIRDIRFEMERDLARRTGVTPVAKSGPSYAELGALVDDMPKFPKRVL